MLLLLLLLSLHMALKHAIKQPRHWSIAWSVKLCWLLTTFQSDAISGHQRPSLVSDKQVFLRDGFNRSPGADALVSFSCSQGWKWMVHTTVMSCCSNSCCQTSVKLLATFAFQCIARAQEHRTAVTQDSRLYTRRGLPTDQTSVFMCQFRFYIVSIINVRLSLSTMYSCEYYHCCTH